MTKMFEIDGKRVETWNPFVGCKFQCTYCWARKMVAGRVKNLPQYRGGFEPHMVIFRTCKPYYHFSPGKWVFVTDMGDISFASDEEFGVIRGYVEQYPQTNFMLLSKNPRRFQDWEPFPPNVWLGTTIETNRDTALFSKAPKPLDRAVDLRATWQRLRFVSIEPIMDFDFEIMLTYLKHIRPGMVFIGADNHKNHLPEPSWDKVQALLAELRKFVPQVVEKEGLERLNFETIH